MTRCIFFTLFLTNSFEKCRTKSFENGYSTFCNLSKLQTPFESVEVFPKNLFLARYFFLSLSMIFMLLCLLPSAALFMLTIWPFGPSPPSVPTAVEATLRTLFRLERWNEYWCHLLNSRKCEASFFSVDPHQVHLQPNLLLLNSRLRFNPTPTFLGVILDRTLSFSKHASSLKVKFFPRLNTVSLLAHGALQRISSLFCVKLFFGPLSLMLHPDGFLALALPILPNWSASTSG